MCASWSIQNLALETKDLAFCATDLKRFLGFAEKDATVTYRYMLLLLEEKVMS